jgi:hypothetical protein
MKFWTALLAPLLMWLAHFMGLYGAAEFAPTALSALTPVLTALAVLVLVALMFRYGSGHYWQTVIVRGGAVLSLVAVLWQTLPVYL